MFIDFNKEKNNTKFKARICVIGSGIVGLSFISEYLQIDPIEIIVLESGDLYPSVKKDNLNKVINTGEAQSGIKGSRARVFGGTSTLWGGQITPLLPIDFQERAWVKSSGWPFQYDSLLPFYKRAAINLGINEHNFDEDIWAPENNFKQQINPESLILTYSKWTPSPNFSKTFKKKLKKTKHFTVLYNATVVNIELNDAKTATTSVSVKNEYGLSGSVSADYFIIACGGIENARILLASNDRCAEGIGNKNDLVGRCFQEHASVYGGRLEPIDFKKFKALFSSYFKGNQIYLPKLQLSPQHQSAEKILNTSGNIEVQYLEGSAIALKQLFNDTKARSFDQDTIKAFIDVIKNPLDAFNLVFSYAMQRRMYFPRNATYFLLAFCETEANVNSRITLSNETDDMGMSKAVIDWQLSDSTRQTMLVYMQRASEELERLGIANTIIKPSLFEHTDEWKSHIYGIHHHIGTTRMHEDPTQGVVDGDCKVHGINNLYIAGNSVFPTSGAANPTYTAIALVIKLADHLKNKINNPTT